MNPPQVFPVQVFLGCGSVIVPLVVAVACVIYAFRARSFLSIALLLGAVGQFVMAIVWHSFNLFAARWMMLNPGWFRFVWPMNIVINVFTILAGLLFAIALVFVLRKASPVDREAPPEDAGTQGVI
jgi:hypothetical protein